MNPKYRHVTVKNADKLISRFERVVERNYRDHHFALAAMAAEMGMSERQLQRKLRKHAGQSPSEYVRTYRLSKSLEHLLAGESVKDTALAVGFSSQAYFASCFKSEYGRTPTDYKDRRIIDN